MLSVEVLLPRLLLLIVDRVQLFTDAASWTLHSRLANQPQRGLATKPTTAEDKRLPF